MEAFLEAREKGLIRFIGFSAHSEEAALALMSGFQFDTILFPINWACWYGGKFGPKVSRTPRRAAWGSWPSRRWPSAPGTKPRSVPGPSAGMHPSIAPRKQAGLALYAHAAVTAALSPSHAELLWWPATLPSTSRPLRRKKPPCGGAQHPGEDDIPTASRLSPTAAARYRSRARRPAGRPAGLRPCRRALTQVTGDRALQRRLATRLSASHQLTQAGIDRWMSWK